MAVAAAAVIVLLLFGPHAVGGSARTAGRAQPATADSSVLNVDVIKSWGFKDAPGTGPVSPDRVIAGVYVSNIQRVDRTTNSFDADFYIWLRWTNPDIDPTKGIEIMNLYQSWALTVTPQYDEPRRQPDGSLVWLARYQGSFNAAMSLADYPFERQMLKIVIEDGDQSVKHIVYEPDKDPIGLDPNITLAGYNFGQPRIEFGTNTYRSSFGEIDTTPDDRTYTRMIVAIPVSSPATSGIITIILPIIIVLVASGLGLIIPASYVDSKVNVPITALLALVAMHFVIASGLPDVSYLLMIDVVYLLAYATVTAMLAGAVLGAWKLKEKGEEAAMTLQRRYLVSISATFLMSLAAVFVIYLL